MYFCVKKFLKPIHNFFTIHIFNKLILENPNPINVGKDPLWSFSSFVLPTCGHRFVAFPLVTNLWDSLGRLKGMWHYPREMIFGISYKRPLGQTVLTHFFEEKVNTPHEFKTLLKLILQSKHMWPIFFYNGKPTKRSDHWSLLPGDLLVLELIFIGKGKSLRDTLSHLSFQLVLSF